MTVAVRSLALAVVTLAAAAACARTVRVAPATVSAELPSVACADVAVDTSGWVRTAVADLGIEFERPARFHPQALGARQRPGWGAYEWRRDGDRAEALTARVLNDYDLRNRETTWARWAGAPNARTCALARDGQTARVVVLDEDGLPAAQRAASDERARQTVVAEWEFAADRVVRLTGHTRDAAELDELLAIVRTAHFTTTPVPPTQCRPPFNCGLPEE